MNDPHVERLHYCVVAGETVNYEKAKPESWSVLNGRFQVSIDSDQMTVEPIDHFASADEARAVVDPLLRTWEIQANLREGCEAISFRFLRADVIDRDPQPEAILAVGVGAFIAVGSSVSVVVGRGKYPEPPTSGAYDPATERMYRRLTEIWKDDKYLTADGYYILTEVEDRFGPNAPFPRRAAGRRARASQALGIDRAVLDMLGDLTSERGGAGARKAKGAACPLTESERRWIREAVRAIVNRSLECDANPVGTFPEITLNDLPPLP